MEYTVQRLARLAGVSSRSLRYYDEIGLLKPARINSSGYRIYGPKEVDQLQHILFYRELGVDLQTIKRMLSNPHFNKEKALCQHRDHLLEKRKQLDSLIANVEKTIASAQGEIKMSDREKFIGFKQKWIDENEQNYGKEIRKKYGEDTIDRANTKLKNMTKEEYDMVTCLEAKIKEDLGEAMRVGDPASEGAQKVAALHKQWLNFYWSDYTKEAHAGLAHMYVADERFSAYYDAVQPGAAAFLRDAILIYTGNK
ncbi:DNA-binding transcriptional MerR regulator [Pullulanibacillus pueri]|uniref:MerR family transcriptional regulator n=1 Tax=Pullulanibacillus pueri TaxID=1437324 RepID=A0A8J3ELZ1_9BACL|nr:MerR family transcriptional regulator [Pullulanibacillus pueri]MBM7680803.1 DNA-binding transcriptional MerR regulator [Pullulanibacillus pueri]GGH78395.1 MerR family transcriptional regulator [Pullulanibacillus pueri]